MYLVFPVLHKECEDENGVDAERLSQHGGRKDGRQGLVHTVDEHILQQGVLTDVVRHLTSTHLLHGNVCKMYDSSQNIVLCEMI